MPVERLFDEVWGDDLPASAAHSLESYVSRLRRALSPYGVTVERRGGGYRIVLGGAVLDSQVFEVLVEQAAQALAGGDNTRAASIAKEALGLWHGPVLADVTLHRGEPCGGRASRRASLAGVRDPRRRGSGPWPPCRARGRVAPAGRGNAVSRAACRAAHGRALSLGSPRRGTRGLRADAARPETISASGRARNSSASRGRSSARSLTFGRRHSRCRPATVSERG